MKNIFAFLFCLLHCTAFAQQDSSFATATVKEGTVYFGYGAELTHAAKTSIYQSTKYIVIDKLSSRLDLNSLQISCPQDVSLLSQVFTTYTPAVAPMPESPVIKLMQDSIVLLKKQIEPLQNNIAIDEATLDATGKLIESTIATSTSKTSLTAEVLKLVDYYNKKIEISKNAVFISRQKISLIQEKINLIALRIASTTSKLQQDFAATHPTQKTYGRIIMQVLCRTDRQADIGISYYTRDAGWQPNYDIRVDTKTNGITLFYKASLTQKTGIDWKDIKLSLSTGTPNFTTTPPVFNPWYLQLYAPGIYSQLNGKSALPISNSIPAMDKALSEEIVATADGYTKRKQEIQPSTLNGYSSLRQGMLNTIFDIDLPYDIESNGLAHSINIKEKSLTGSFKNYAVPKLDAEAYLLAELTDWQNLDLIAGNANVIIDDTYIGKSFIDPNSVADTLNLSLGKDKRIAVKRQLLSSTNTAKTKDNFIKQTYTYQLTVKNNKVKSTDLILKDQFPLSQVKEIEVSLTDDGGAAVNNDVGVLTWTATLKPGEIRTYTFSYTVKYPKDKKIQNLK